LGDVHCPTVENGVLHPKISCVLDAGQVSEKLSLAGAKAAVPGGGKEKR